MSLRAGSQPLITTGLPPSPSPSSQALSSAGARSKLACQAPHTQGGGGELPLGQIGEMERPKEKVVPDSRCLYASEGTGAKRASSLMLFPAKWFSPSHGVLRHLEI